MSILRKYPLKQPKAVVGIDREYKVELCEGAEDMPVIVDRLKRGMTPQTCIANYGSAVFTEEQMFSQMPKKIVDPTDVNFKDYVEKVEQQKESKEEEI